MLQKNKILNSQNIMELQDLKVIPEAATGDVL